MNFRNRVRSLLMVVHSVEKKYSHFKKNFVKEIEALTKLLVKTLISRKIRQKKKEMRVKFLNFHTVRYLLCWWRVAQYTCLEQQLKIEVMSWSFGVFTCSRYATVIRMASVFFQKYFTVWKLRNFTRMIFLPKIPWNQLFTNSWISQNVCLFYKWFHEKI